MIRITGPSATQLRELFVDTWRTLSGDDSGKLMRLGLSEPPGYRGSPVRTVANFFRGQHRAIRRSYLTEIASARSQVYIANSYFVPDRRVRLALAAAAERGVDVRVLVPGQSDVIAVYYAGRKLYGWLIDRGIKLYEWQGPVLHSKSAVIDERWCTVGTYNLDYRSLRFNLEVTVTVEDRAVGHAMKAKFEEDLEKSVPVSLQHFRFRPLSVRLLENFFYLFRKLL
jgi:cardiolipin synthase